MPRALTSFQRKLFADIAKQATTLLVERASSEIREVRATNCKLEEQVLMIDDSLGVSLDGERFWVLTEHKRTAYEASELDPVCLRYFLAAFCDTAVV